MVFLEQTVPGAIFHIHLSFIYGVFKFRKISTTYSCVLHVYTISEDETVKDLSWPKRLKWLVRKWNRRQSVGFLGSVLLPLEFVSQVTGPSSWGTWNHVIRTNATSHISDSDGGWFHNTHAAIDVDNFSVNDSFALFPDTLDYF